MENITLIKRFFLLSTMLTILLFTSSCATKVEPLPSTTETITTETITTETIATESTTIESQLTYKDVLKENLQTWGLGSRLIDYVSNDRAYDWYIDQGDTGTHSDANCGPASVTMAALWANHQFDKTAEDARKKFSPLGGWWYGDDIEGCLDYFDVDYSVIYIEDAYTLISIIDSGKIAIINNSMNYVPYVSGDASRVNRFYSFDSGHYLIVKGYAKVDTKTYFEVYDPNNWGMTYADGTEMGKNRYYDSESLMNSVENWYPYAVMINP